MSTADQLARLTRAFPRQEISRGTFETYLADLAEIPEHVLAHAVTDLIRSRDFFPSIAEIRRACAERVLALPTERDALAALDRRAPLPAHPLIHQAVRAHGGVGAYRASTDPDRWREQFRRTYAAMRADAIRTAQLRPALEQGPNG